MAVYDPESKKLVVRVVYDGPGMAGKTTNLQQICAIFAPERRSDLYNGLTAASRTLCLDWMQLDGGLVRGHELRCHLLTVPGQAVLERRRQMLLSMADSVVFVVESSEEGLREAFPMWRSLLAWTGGSEASLPLLIQANKQDLPGALSAAELRQRWKLDASVPIVCANAAAGQGVRETVVLAIRGAVIVLQNDLATCGLAELEGTYETGQELERRIMATERANPASAADGPRLPFGAPTSASNNAEPLAVPLAPREEQRRRPRAPRTPPKRSAQSGVFVAPATSRAKPQSKPRVAATPTVRPWFEKIKLPSADAETGLVWPAIEGRRTLRRVPVVEATRRHPVEPSSARGNRPRASDEVIFEAGIWCLKTSLSCCFSSAEQAEDELLRLANVKRELGTLCVPRTVLVVQRNVDDTYWVWTISLWLTTLETQFDYALRTGDEGTLSDALGQYARVVIRALRMCLDQNAILDLRPRNFGVLGDEAFYLADDLPRGDRLPLAGRAMLAPFDQFSAFPGALRVYLEILLHDLALEVSADEADQLGLGDLLDETPVSSEAGSTAKAQLGSALVRRRKAVP